MHDWFSAMILSRDAKRASRRAEQATLDRLKEIEEAAAEIRAKYPEADRQAYVPRLLPTIQPVPSSQTSGADWIVPLTILGCIATF